jgi:IPT/TIG domain
VSDGTRKGTRQRGRRRARVAEDAAIAALEALRTFEWPPLFDPRPVERLVEGVDAAARNSEERAVFRAILKASYERVLELESLYRDLPGVLGDDPDAVRAFREILDRAGTRGVGVDQFVRDFGDFSLKPVPDGDGGFGCRPHLVVKPPVVYFLSLGIERLAQGDVDLRTRYLDTLLGLWEQAAYLDAMSRHAERDVTGYGSSLTRFLRVTARDARIDWDRGGESRGVGDLAGLGGPEPGPWPPPGGGSGVVLPPLPGPRPLPNPRDICAMLEFGCKMLVVGGISGFVHAPISTYTTGITSISPKTACPGNQVTINGSGFGATQPAEVEVIIGNVVAPVDSWADAAIVITVPAGAKSGCVAFRNKTLEAQRLAAYQQNEEAIASIAEGFACLGVGGFWPKSPPLMPSPAPCIGANHLTIGPPVIDWFTVTSPGLTNTPTGPTVIPGSVLTLNWQAMNASSVRIRRTSPAGPYVNPNIVHPPSGTLNIGAWAGGQPATATYEIEATNSCGTVTRTITVGLDQPPVLSVVGIEVVQVIQTPANSVRLVANKRTIVRVSVDSGISNNFNKGTGANLQPDVTGDCTIFPGGAGMGFGAGAPLNTNGDIDARPAASINRDVFEHTLNFELPVNRLSGSVRVDVRVWVGGHENDVGGPWRASGMTTVSFVVEPTQEVLPLLINDAPAGPLFPLRAAAPPFTAYLASLQGARTRYPVAETGFIVNPPLTLTTQQNRDLTTVIGWNLLVMDLATIIFIFPSTPVGGIRTALVPANATFAFNGMATPRVGPAVPAMAAQAGLPATFAHEMSHCVGLGHAPCGGPAPPIDARLPGTTEDTGMDVATAAVIPAGRGELMSLCGGQGRWPAIAHYDGVLFTSLPI